MLKNLAPIFLGICASLFFSVTFILNRSMELSGGSWVWSASLRYYFMIPILLIIVLSRKNLGDLFKVMNENLMGWIFWSTVGFGIFYTPLCFAAEFSPGWLIASSWQITIISGLLLSPLFTNKDSNGYPRRGKIPLKGLAMSTIILVGITVMQIEQANNLSFPSFMLGILPVIIASFAYPLGNRKMMEICDSRLDVFQRVLGMTISSIPFWLLLSIYGVIKVGLPGKEQVVQSSIVAIFSGVVATALFFQATDMASKNMQMLGAVEATQSMEVLFTVAGELLFLTTAIPSVYSWIGMAIVMVGMILHSYVSQKEQVSYSNKKTVNY